MPNKSLLPDPTAAVDWTEFRRELPVTQKWAYFDHAAVAPLSQRAYDRMARWSAEALLDGDANWTAWARQAESARSRAAQILNADTAEVGLVPNTSWGINLVAEGFPWNPGDNVVLPAGEFPSNVYPWMNLRDRGVEVRIVPLDGVRVSLDRIADACDSRTRILSASWVGYVSGYRLDPAELADLAHRRGALFFLDAIQGLGVFPLDVRKTGVDFLAADGHKWLLGPEGAGIFYTRAEHLPLLRPLNVGWNSVVQGNDFSRIELNLKPTAARYESGSQNLAGFIGLAGSLETLQKFGLGSSQSAIGLRVLELTDRLHERLIEAGYECLADRSTPAVKSGILAFRDPRIDSQHLKTELFRDRVVISCRSGWLRCSVHGFNAEEDFDRLFAALQRVARRQ